MKRLAVVLGRFAPLHIGHQKVIDSAISDFGIKSTLVLIGSSTSYNTRTPYTLSARKQMIKAVYPKIKIAEISDIKAKKEHFNIDTLIL